MITEQIANRYYELAQQNQLETIQAELYATEAISIEPENKYGLPLEVRGLADMRQKEEAFGRQIEQVYGGYCTAPITSEFFFTCGMGMDVTFRGEERRMKHQIGVFEVADGKIIKEQFFYRD